MPATPSVITRSSAAISGNRPLLVNDPLIRSGTKLLFDATDAFGAIPAAGALAAGATVSDLQHSPVVGTVSGTALSVLAAFAGLGSNGGAGGIAFGTAGQCAVPVANELLVMLSLKQTANAAAYAPLAWCGPAGATNGNACQWFIDMGVGGAQPRLQIGTGSSIINQQLAVDAIKTSPTNIALRYRPSDGLIQIYRNGLVFSSATLGATNLQSGATRQVFFNAAALTGTFYRLSVHDITQSIADETAQGYAAADILDAPAMILREHQFVTNALTAAPRDVLV